MTWSIRIACSNDTTAVEKGKIYGRLAIDDERRSKANVNWFREGETCAAVEGEGSG